MDALSVDGIDLFKIAGRSISRWISASRRALPRGSGNHFVASSKSVSFSGLNIPQGCQLRLRGHWPSVCSHVPIAHSQACFLEGPSPA